MLVLFAGIARVVMREFAALLYGAPLMPRMLGITAMTYVDAGASGSVGWNVTALPAMVTVPARRFPFVKLLTMMAPADDDGSSATSNVAIGRNASVALIVDPSAGVSDTRCGACDAKTSVPNGTISSASGFLGPAAVALSPPRSVRAMSENVAAGLAGTGNANTPPLRVKSTMPSADVCGEPAPAVTRADATPGPVPPLLTCPNVNAIGLSAVRMR